MNIDKIFKKIWQINGLFILLGLILIFAIIIFEFTNNLFRDEFRQEQTLDLANDDKNTEKWSLGYPEEIPGSKFYLIPLESENKHVEEKSRGMQLYGSGSSYSSNRSKNILFINSVTNKSNWLFESVQQLILSKSILTTQKSEDILIAKAIYYEVINSDTNNDNIYDYTDKRTFALTHPDGSGYSEIISGYNRIVQSVINDEGNLFVIYINNEKVHSMLVDLNNFKIINKAQLPRVKAS